MKSALISFNRPFIPFSIRAKIFILVAFLVMMLAFAGMTLQTALNNNRELIQRQSDIIQALTTLSSASQDYGQLRWRYMTFLNQPNAQTKEKADSSLAAFNDNLVILDKLPMQDPLQELERKLQQLRDTSALLLLESHPNSPDKKVLAQEALTSLGSIDADLDRLTGNLKTMLTQSSQDTLQKTAALQKIPLIFIVGGLLTVGFVLSVLILDIFVPVRRITSAMTSASLDTDNARNYVLPVEHEDEVGRATYALNHLLREVSSGIERIRSTEIKLRETGQYLQTIMDNMLDGIVIVDMDGIIKSFNPAAEKILGLKKEEAMGRSFIQSFSFEEKTRQYILSQLQTVDNSGQHAPYEIYIAREDNDQVPIEILIGTATFHDKPMNIITLRDISSRKKMEALLNHAQRMEAIGRMSGGIAHDFNNMLIVISGNLELIERRVQDKPELREMIDDALKSVTRGKDLTQRILAFSRKQVLKPGTFNINEKLADIIELIRRAVREDVEVETVLAPDLWDVNLDPSQFESSILNLAINSRDAITGSEGKITIITQNFTFLPDRNTPFTDMQSGDYVMISVSDNGSGIALEDINQVFEPFFTTKEIDKGTGLGLSIVYGFTRQSGGYVTISSLPGKGTTVKLYFPRSAEEKKGVKPANDYRIAEDLTGGKESLLVVEDQPDVLKYLTTTLRELGYRVTSAKDGPSALKRMESRKHLDLLVTDIVMPGNIDGEELATEVRKKFPAIKTLYISGYTSNALIENGSLKKDVNLLSKPFTRAELARQVRKCLEETPLRKAKNS